MSVSEVFRRITAALNQAGIAYMLSGSFASTFYGAPRSTQDIDMVIDATPEQLRVFAEELPSEKYYVDLEPPSKPIGGDRCSTSSIWQRAGRLT